MMDICIVFPAPIILALSINEVKNKMGKRVVQSITYLPHFISWAVVGGLFYMFFSVSTGPVNAVIKAAGGAGINFMGSSVWYRWMVVLSSVWKEVGWGSIVYLAAITGVDEELYEAAAIDGGKPLELSQIHYPAGNIVGNIGHAYHESRGDSEPEF